MACRTVRRNGVNVLISWLNEVSESDMFIRLTLMSNYASTVSLSHFCPIRAGNQYAPARACQV